MMEKNEVITLSSDDESDFIHRLEYNLNSSTTITRCSKNSSDTLKSYLQKFDQISENRNVDVTVKSNENEVKKRLDVSEKKFKEDKKKDPEFVDLVECIEKPNDCSQSQCRGHKSNKTMQDHSKVDIICIDETPVQNAFSLEKKFDENASLEQGAKKMFCVLPLENINKNKEKIINNISNTSKPVSNNKIEKFNSKTDEEIEADENSNQNLKFFTEFVELCGSLEEIPNDRARLTKKLMKRYGEADCSYIKSQEFRNLIQKCKEKVNTYNLYLLAKEITDELSYQKKVEIKPNQIKMAKGKSQSVVECNEKIQKINGERTKNLTKFINRIVKKLDKLGSKIRELETQEVDLSDEEESSYVQLQRYRERFCQIYTKLCKYTNEIADADRFYSRKICFTESKYPAINKCIENWLNKTRTFPDFSDIMKLLDSQSFSLGLPSNRESIRMIAIEIFQQVGAMLQRRRIYDLWDSFCGFLDEGEDPANTDPSLDKVLKSNFETRIKKEQEIFQYFVELQEKERLEPKEVLDEEANHSPVESGNEDHEEIEDIENFLNKKLDDAIKKETEEKGNNAWSDDENDSEKKTQPHHSLKTGNTVITSKESKNNFKNCKSLKWRLESCEKMGSINSEEGNAATKIEKEKEMETSKGDISDPSQPDSKEENKKSEKSEKNYSNPVFVALSNIKSNPKEVYNKIISETVSRCLSPSKRAFIVEDKDKNQNPKKKKCTIRSENKLDFEISNLNSDNENSMEKTKVFNVHCCQILTDDIFENISKKKKDWGKKRVFRDLTNVNRLMELYGKRNKVSGLYSSSFFHRTFSEFEKSSWKKRYKMSFKFVGSKDQKCALNQEEKSKKTINSSKGAGKKDIKNNPESGRNDQGDGFFSGHGNGREEDNNEDKNQKNGKSTEDLNENQLEEDDDEEENDTEKDDNKLDTETAIYDLNKKELSFANKKTEEPLEVNQNNSITLNIQNNTSENVETTQLSNNAQSKTPASDSKSKNENKEQSGDKKVFSTRKKSKTQKNNRQFNKEKKSKVKISKSESKIDVGNTEKKLSNMKCSQSVSKIVTLNSKTDINIYTLEIQKSNLCEQKTEKENTEGATEKKQNENANKKIESDTRTQLSTDQTITEVKDESKLIARNKRKRNSCSGAEKVEVRRKISDILKKHDNVKAQTITQTIKNKSANTWKSTGMDTSSQKFQRKNTPSTSDDEIVKRFLMSSPSSISITPPRKLSFSKPPSQAALQALATLRNLKGISTTIVRSKPKNEDDVIVIESSYDKDANQNAAPGKRKRRNLPVISSVQSIDSTTPKIVTVQGNVSGFENSWPEMTNNSDSECNSSLSSSAIRISNVWGNLGESGGDNFMQSKQNNRSFTPGRSSRQSDAGSSNSVKKKNTEKTVEYVVLE